MRAFFSDVAPVFAVLRAGMVDIKTLAALHFFENV
jgi:hypothetical protein